MTYGMALELRRTTITVNCVAPGAIEGDRIDRVIEGARQAARPDPRRSHDDASSVGSAQATQGHRRRRRVPRDSARISGSVLAGQRRRAGGARAMIGAICGSAARAQARAALRSSELAAGRPPSGTAHAEISMIRSKPADRARAECRARAVHARLDCVPRARRRGCGRRLHVHRVRDCRRRAHSQRVGEVRPAVCRWRRARRGADRVRLTSPLPSSRSSRATTISPLPPAISGAP